jgi:predicted ATPase
MSYAEWTVSAQDFWVLRNVTWSPSGVCLLSGPNGAGKSSILDVLKFLQIAASRGLPEAVRLVGGGAPLQRLGAEPKAPVRLGLSIGDLSWEIQLLVESGSIHANHGEVIKHSGNVLARRAMYSTDVFLGKERRDAGWHPPSHGRCRRRGGLDPRFRRDRESAPPARDPIHSRSDARDG